MSAGTVMILGGGIYQLPLIRKAKEMHLTTVVVSIPGPYPGLKEADEVLSLDTRDAEAVLSAASARKIDGILTTGTDVAVRTIGTVTERLRLPGISARAARIVTDKAEMKRAFSGRVSTAEFEIVRTVEEAVRAAGRIGYPVVMKACDVSGSRGVTRVDCPEALPEAYRASEKVSRADYYIVEKYVSGHEIGLDAYVSGGRILFAGAHEKYVCRAGGVTIPAGHGFPLPMSTPLEEELMRQLEAVVTSTGMDNCAVNCDIMLLPGDKVSVIEAGGRCGATCIPELIELHTGIDYYRQMILGALGEPLDFRITQRVPCQARLLFSRKSGTVGHIDRDGLRRLKEQGFSVSLDVGEGDRVEQVRNGTDRIGQIIASRVSEQEMEKALQLAEECIRLEDG